MFSKSIKIKNFSLKNKSSSSEKKILISFKKLIGSNNHILSSMKDNYKDSYSKKLIYNLKKYKNVNLIGMGGSILGTKTIYNFLDIKKKKFNFIDNFSNISSHPIKEKTINLIISKSGSTLETLSNFNILSNQKKSIFLTENKNSYLFKLANKLKAEVVHHSNYIGGRYSVLSEVGMLPAELMGLNEKKFKRFNYLVNNKYFINSLIKNVISINNFIKKGKTNLVILNYDEKSDGLFHWYQQLLAESLGKKKKGVFPIVSTMPRDNHSLLQLYLDGPKKNFYTIFSSREKNSQKLNNKYLMNNYSILKNKNINKILESQKKATENVFRREKIPFRSFEITNRSEETLGELFCFFILETILLGHLLKVNPFDQPKVELIKNETKKILI